MEKKTNKKKLFAILFISLASLTLMNALVIYKLSNTTHIEWEVNNGLINQWFNQNPDETFLSFSTIPPEGINFEIDYQKLGDGVAHHYNPVLVFKSPELLYGDEFTSFKIDGEEKLDKLYVVKSDGTLEKFEGNNWGTNVTLIYSETGVAELNELSDQDIHSQNYEFIPNQGLANGGYYFDICFVDNLMNINC